MRTTVDLPEPLLNNAKLLAVRRNATLSAVIEDALRQHLGAKRRTPPPPFKLHTVAGRLIDPSLDLDRTSALDIRGDEAAFSHLPGRH